MKSFTKFIGIAALLLLFALSTEAQSVGVNTNMPDPSAALDVTSTTQGVLVPRMLSTQRTMIGAGTPAGHTHQNLQENSYFSK